MMYEDVEALERSYATYLPLKDVVERLEAAGYSVTKSYIKNRTTKPHSDYDKIGTLSYSGNGLSGIIFGADKGMVSELEKQAEKFNAQKAEDEVVLRDTYKEIWNWFKGFRKV